MTDQEKQTQESWIGKVGRAIRIPLMVVFAAVFIAKVGKHWEWFSEDNIKLLDPLIDPSTSLKLLFSIGLFLMGAVGVKKADEKEEGRIKRMRVALAVFFAAYAYVVAQGLVPLPDVAPRIEFKGVLAVAAGTVIAFFCLIGRYRIFLLSVWLFMIWVAFPQMEKRLTFLEMMLEPLAMERATYYGMAGIFLILMTNRALRAFSDSVSEYKLPAPMFFKKGFPF